MPCFHYRRNFLVLLEGKAKERAVVPGGQAGLWHPLCSVVTAGILYKATSFSALYLTLCFSKACKWYFRAARSSV